MGMIQTSMYGEIEVSESSIVTFPVGIPGFEQLKKFVVLQLEDGVPFAYLQSIEEEDIAFVIVDPFLFYPKYDFELSESTIEELAITSQEDVIVWSIVTMKKVIEEATINLIAPIIINAEKQTGKQIILHGSDYTSRHKLISGLTNMSAEGDADASIKP
jgi:flagellar assembly factor FliW